MGEKKEEGWKRGIIDALIAWGRKAQLSFCIFLSNTYEKHGLILTKYHWDSKHLENKFKVEGGEEILIKSVSFTQKWSHTILLETKAL